jgi:hypothetical protein
MVKYEFVMWTLYLVAFAIARDSFKLLLEIKLGSAPPKIL